MTKLLPLFCLLASSSAFAADSRKVAIADVTKDAAVWSGKPILLGTACRSGRIKIDLPNSAPKEERYKEFVASLAKVGCVALEGEGFTRIVAKVGVDRAQRAVRAATAPAGLPDGRVSMNYPEKTPEARVVDDVAKWSGRKLELDPRIKDGDVNVQLMAPEAIPTRQAYALFAQVLDELGLTEVPDGDVIRISTIREAKADAAKK